MEYIVSGTQEQEVIYIVSAIEEEPSDGRGSQKANKNKQ